MRVKQNNQEINGFKLLKKIVKTAALNESTFLCIYLSKWIDQIIYYSFYSYFLIFNDIYCNDT